MCWRLAGALLVLLAAGAAVWAVTKREDGSEAVALQECVDRWNWMHFGGSLGRPELVSVPAKVVANPCRVEIAYRFPPSDRKAGVHLGFYFPCRLNRFGAYRCASHASGSWDDPPRASQNARYVIRSGTLTLDRPPARPPATQRPEWVQRYPVERGFVVPFDRRGRLRWGVTIRGTTPLFCHTFKGIRQRSTLFDCGTGLFCFVPRLPVRDGQRLACPVAGGSRTFRRGRLVVLPDP